MTAIFVVLVAILFLWVGIRLGASQRPDPNSIRIGDTILMGNHLVRNFEIRPSGAWMPAPPDDQPRYQTDVVRLVGLDRTREGHLIMQVQTVNRTPVF